MARINLEVNEATKSRWMEAADESPEANGNLSSFIRLAVENEIGGRSESDSPTTSTESIEDLSEMAETSDRILHSLDSIQGQLESLKRESRSDPDLDALKNEVFSHLPTSEEFEAWHYASPEGRAGKSRPPETNPEALTRLAAERGGDPAAIAEVLDASTYRVLDALDKLMEDTPLVREVEIDGETRYCKEV